MESENLTLEVWRGDWGLPSVDPHCLAVMAYCKFSNVPVTVLKSSDPWNSPTGSFPLLRSGDRTYSRVSDIFTFLKKENWNNDSLLSTKDSADMLAYSAMLEEKLLPAVLFTWWIDEQTYVDVIRPWYIHVIPFPRNFLCVRRLQKAAELRVKLTKGGDDLSYEELEDKVYQDAKDCISDLSRKLDEQPYMFGDQPSSLDALVFGYLAPLLKAPVPNKQLRIRLQHFNSLPRLCDDILTKFFSETDTESEEKDQDGDMNDVLDTLNRKKLFLAAVFAISAMVGYALSHGLIEVTVSDAEPRLNVNQPYLPRPL